jgi:hypothetical protein
METGHGNGPSRSQESPNPFRIVRFMAPIPILPDFLRTVERKGVFAFETVQYSNRDYFKIEIPVSVDPFAPGILHLALTHRAASLCFQWKTDETSAQQAALLIFGEKGFPLAAQLLYSNSCSIALKVGDLSSCSMLMGRLQLLESENSEAPAPNPQSASGVLAAVLARQDAVLRSFDALRVPENLPAIAALDQAETSRADIASLRGWPEPCTELERLDENDEKIAALVAKWRVCAKLKPVFEKLATQPDVLEKAVEKIVAMAGVDAAQIAEQPTHAALDWNVVKASDAVEIAGQMPVAADASMEMAEQ